MCQLRRAPSYGPSGARPAVRDPPPVRLLWAVMRASARDGVEAGSPSRMNTPDAAPPSSGAAVGLGMKRIMYVGAALALAVVVPTAAPTTAHSSACTHHWPGPQVCIRPEGRNGAL
ncbi:hypothetical protein GCM10023323_71570 [Streptomyces thinghirensis]|uniref:Uncharacterized protein n=1 Tax=Streptomyces thinghirensis TaxID=551547 RepID=A0ABP9TG72_9ACTN